ncbi:MAG: hypothetical protein HKN36_06750 [Hellea sp.]|nr:hypothetical protein [Hellea sp.]
MKNFVSILSVAALTAAFGATAYASSPDVYVVNFRNDQSAESQQLDRELNSAMSMVGGSAEQVIIDTSNAAKWQKGAHEAFDRDIVPVFNQWVGLPGFAAIVDANSKQVIGCVNSSFSSAEIAEQVRAMASRAAGNAQLSTASTRMKTTQCPAAHNTPPGS